MRRKLFTLAGLLTVASLLTMCGSATVKTPDDAPYYFVQPLPGDSTVYGLACDGCNDTLLILICNIDEQPDTFSVLEATRAHRVLGRPQTGDLLAVVTDSLQNSTARMVVNMNQLKGRWCYEVTPQLRKRADFTEESRLHFLKNIPDSLRKELFKPREYGFELNGDFTAMPVGRYRDEGNESPMEYPTQKRYHEWHLLNGRLLLSVSRPDENGNQMITDTDTATFVTLRRDSLVLLFSDNKQQTYYRK